MQRLPSFEVAARVERACPVRVKAGSIPIADMRRTFDLTCGSGIDSRFPLLLTSHEPL